MKNEKKSLVQISPSLDYKLGGPVRVVAESIEFLRESFHHHLIVIGINNSRVRTDSLESSFLRNRYAFRIFPLSKKSRVAIREADMILIHGFFTFATLLALFHSTNSKIYLMPHGSLELYEEKRNKYLKLLFSSLVKILASNKPIHFLTGSESEAIIIRAKYPNFCATSVGLGINPVESPGQKDCEMVSQINLLSISRIAKKKRIDISLKALSELRNSPYTFHLHIVGDGKQRIIKGLKRLASDLEIEKHVTFHGHLDGSEKEKIFNSAHVFLLPSENENFAVAVAESISHEVPVVISKFVAMHEFVDLHQTGITMDNLYPSTLARDIIRIINQYGTFRDNCANNKKFLAWDFVKINWIDSLDVKSKNCV